MNNCIQISEQLLLAVKMQQATSIYTSGLEQLSLDQLNNCLSDDRKKKVFWINLYNAYYQIIKSSGSLTKTRIFSSAIIPISQHKFSLDDIEHGILRRFSHKYSLGYFKNPFVNTLIKSLAVSHIDYRIHFALNCGAKSCPPIAFYNEALINEQLEQASISYIESDTIIDEKRQGICVSRIFLWFLADFGGITGVRKILEEKLNFDIKDYKIVFKKFNWDTHLDNYLD